MTGIPLLSDPSVMQWGTPPVRLSDLVRILPGGVPRGTPPLLRQESQFALTARLDDPIPDHGWVEVGGGKVGRVDPLEGDVGLG